MLKLKKAISFCLPAFVKIYYTHLKCSIATAGKLLIAICLLAFTTTTYPTIRYLRHEGSNTPPYLTWGTAADSIMSAINISEFGDTIYVADRVYKEQVIMILGLTLLGAGADSFVIDTREFANSTEFQVLIMAGSCIISGFHLLVSNNNEGIGIQPRDIDVQIENNKITNSGWGIHLINSNSKVVKNQILEVSLRGVEIEAFNYSYRPLIENNLISTEQFGIMVFFGTRPTIRNNIIFLNGDGADGYNGGAQIPHGFIRILWSQKETMIIPKD